MKRFSLGVLGWTATGFGVTRIGDILDAMRGYNDEEAEKRKYLTETVRRATTILWNIHLTDASYVKQEYELWPLPWDKDREIVTEMNEEEYKRVIREQSEWLMRNHPMS